VIFGYLGGETVEESAKVVDWSMNSISFKPPEGLSGRYVMIIRNEVGATSRVVNLVLGGPLGYSPPLPDSYGNEFGFDTASGVYYKGKFYVFSVDPSDEIRINREFVRVRTFDPSSGHLSANFVPSEKATYARSRRWLSKTSCGCSSWAKEVGVKIPAISGTRRTPTTRALAPACGKTGSKCWAKRK